MSSLTTVQDQSRDLVFNLGDRVHWFSYTRDMVIKDGGYGMIIEITKRQWGFEALPFFKVLIDGNSDIKEFPIHDCDLEDHWEDEIN